MKTNACNSYTIAQNERVSFFAKQNLGGLGSRVKISPPKFGFMSADDKTSGLNIFFTKERGRVFRRLIGHGGITVFIPCITTIASDAV